MKKIVFIFSLVFSFSVYGQVSNVSAEIDKTMRPALSMVAPYNAKNAGAALSEHLKEMGLKGGKNLKGWTFYEGVLIEKISPNRQDYYFKVEQNGKNKEEAIVYLAMSKGYGNFVDESNDKELVEKGKLWMNDFNFTLAQYKLGLDIIEAEKAFDNGVKEYEKSVKAGEDLAKQVESNKADQKAKKDEMDKLKAVVDGLKAKKAAK